MRKSESANRLSEVGEKILAFFFLCVEVMLWLLTKLRGGYDFVNNFCGLSVQILI